MSLDEGVICAAVPESLASYAEREGLDASAFTPNDDGTWGGAVAGASFWLELRAKWQVEAARRNDRWLGEQAQCAVGINGSASRADWSVVRRLACRIAHEAKGVYVSFDESRVLYSPKAAKKRKEDKAARRGEFDAALESLKKGNAELLDALVAATATTKSKRKAKRAAEDILALLARALKHALTEDTTSLNALAECAVRSRAALFALTHDGATSADLAATTPGFDRSLSGDPLIGRIAEASLHLGANASPVVCDVQAALEREREKEAGARWAAEHPPSTVDAADLVRRARAGELYATGVVFGWRETGFGRWLMKQHSELALWPLFANGPML